MLLQSRPTSNSASLLLLLLLLLVVCIGGSLAKHWCEWTAQPCSATCGDEGVIRRVRLCNCKRNRSNVFSKIKDKFVELIQRDCRSQSPQVEFIKCPELPECNEGRPSANQIIAGCIVTIVLLCVLFASAKTWVPALYKYYFVDRDRRRRRRRELAQSQPVQPTLTTNRRADVVEMSSSDNLSASFQSSSDDRHQQQPPMSQQPPTYHDAVYGDVQGEPPPSYTEAVKEQRLIIQQQEQVAVEAAEAPSLNIASSEPLESTQVDAPGPSRSNESRSVV